ncbi:MAG: hypothetical protein HY864_01420 [Chloroflexi bacterium]|nr:hypothetical protein [Chloroflexota bacterium]
MTRSNKLLFSVLAMIVILACNVAGGQAPTSAPDFVATITAQALLIPPPQPSDQPSPIVIVISTTPEPPTQVIFTDTPIPTFTITLTPTPGITTLTVSADTNCRSGPGKEYDYLGALLIGKTAEVVGKNTATGYWIIKNPERAGNCWLWGNYATVSGDTSMLQEFPIPATPTPSAPSAVKGLQANKICFFNGVSYDLNGFISWEDVSNEEGYRIYLNNVVLMGVPANTTTAAIPNLLVQPGISIKMSVEAYNPAGKSAKKSVEIVCP